MALLLATIIYLITQPSKVFEQQRIRTVEQSTILFVPEMKPLATNDRRDTTILLQFFFNSKTEFSIRCTLWISTRKENHSWFIQLRGWWLDGGNASSCSLVRLPRKASCPDLNLMDRHWVWKTTEELKCDLAQQLQLQASSPWFQRAKLWPLANLINVDN